MLDPNSGHVESTNDDGSTHVTDWWSDDTGGHRESYDVNSEGDITGYHYGQEGGDTSITYDYHSDSWGGHAKD